MEHIRNLMTRGLTRRTFLAGLGATAALPILAACAPTVEKEIVEVEKEVTRIVEKLVECPASWTSPISLGIRRSGT